MLRRRLVKLWKQLATAVEKDDDPQEVVRLRSEAEDAEDEARRIKES